MNINTDHLSDTISTETLAEMLDRHHLILMKGTGWDLTGEVALVSPPDRELANIGVLQVWSRAESGEWVHVTPDGVLLTTPDPLGGEQA